MSYRQEIKNRDPHLNISKFYVNKKMSVFIAIIFGGWGVGLIYLNIIDHGMQLDALRMPIQLFAYVLVIGALILVRQTFKTQKSSFNMSFNEAMSLKKTRLSKLFFLTFSIIFCSLFIGVGYFGGKIMFLIIGLFFLTLFVGGILYQFIKDEKRINLTKNHGSTHLVSYSDLRAGSTYEFKIKNDCPDLQLKEIQIKLRFIEEIYTTKKRKSNDNNSKTLTVFYSLEQQSMTLFENGVSSMVQFIFPEDGQSTDIDFKEPKYWELSCINSESNYFSRFVLDVQ